MKLNVKITQNGANQKLAKISSQAVLVRGWLNRVAYPTIIEAQRMRWASEGASEGASWRALNQSYAIRKLKKYAGYPGAGTKMMIATKRLVDSVTGDNTKDHFKLVTAQRLETGSIVEYAKFAAEDRDFTRLGPATMAKLKESLLTYLTGKK